VKIVSFNINGIRARPHQLERLVELQQPDIIGLQETKVQDMEFPEAHIRALGYEVSYFGQKGHYGVAIASLERPVQVQKGYPGDDDGAQRRIISARFDTSKGPLTVINCYCPQGEGRGHPVKFPAKAKFYADLLSYLEQYHRPDERLVLMGDMNIAPLDLDIGIGAENAKRWLRTGKCSFLPEERDWMQRLLAWGLVDSYRAFWPEQADALSWFDYRSRGFEREPRHGLRIDLLLATRSLMDDCQDVGIDYVVRAMDRPSDHCPIWARFV
jgi:exodeoxyribonuclease-3